MAGVIVIYFILLNLLDKHKTIIGNRLIILVFFNMVQKNIKKIRSFKGLSQSAFAELFGLTRASVGAYEEGRAKPKTEIAVQIANYFSIPLELLLTKELTINDIANYDMLPQSASIEETAVNSSTIRFVEAEMLPEYLKQLDQSAFTQSIPVFSLPFIMSGTNICFELDDAYFQNKLNQFKPGDKLFCKAVKNFKKLNSTQYYLVVLDTMFYLSNLAYDRDRKMVFNPHNTVEKIFENEIRECWQVTGVLQMLISQANGKDRLDKYLKL
ncbi:MAG: helix-turn-helix domain-containing protein [Bacteroidetes bacterium]|nr:helix-turn-helix domain-containing protein [Bacteroidota bacterium]